MIVGFRHKGLERFHKTGSTKGINAQHADKLRRQLAMLEISIEAADMDTPGWRLHPLKGDRKGEWAVWVSGNWRLVFTFEGTNTTAVDYEDYH
jgi:proteic killer suppression protein